jgi:hypothetical protein
MIESGSIVIEWLASNSDAVLLLAAALPSVFLLNGGQLLRYGALAVFFVALAWMRFGSDSLAGAVVVTILNSLLVTFAALTTRKRLVQTEDRLEAITSAIRELEIAEERRQTFSARRSRTARSP